METSTQHVPAFTTGGGSKSLGMGGHTLPNEGATKIWLTPPEILDKLNRIRRFDLDPCAAPSPRPWATAHRHIELPEDGLTADWDGDWCVGCERWVPGGGLSIPGRCERCDEPTIKHPYSIWMNPPYDKSIDKWIRRMNEHGSGISLIFARTETFFWQTEIWPKASAILFLDGRLFFHTPDGKRGTSNAGAPSALIAHSKFDADVLEKSGIAGYLVRFPLRIEDRAV